jgi:uncharacterized protein YecE (DUF72 family)
MEATLNEIVSRLAERAPEKVKPLVLQFGPAFARATAEELDAAFDLFLQGDAEAPYALALKNMPEAELLADSAAATIEEREATKANAASVASQKAAARTGAGIVLTLMMGAL